MSARQLYRLVLVPVVWTVYVTGVLVAWDDGGMSGRTLGLVAVLGIPVLLGSLAVALAWKPRPVQRAVPPVRAAWVAPIQVRRVEPVRPLWGGDNAVTRFLDPVPPEGAQPEPVARAVAVVESERTGDAQPGEFSPDAFQAWADGKREGIAEGRAQALEELGLADDDEPGE